jgi:hypothetical protein
MHTQNNFFVVFIVKCTPTRASILGSSSGGFFKKATITSIAYFEGSDSTHVLIFVLKYLDFKIHKTLKLMIYKLKS